MKRPSWTPPGFAFPIIWITISLLRAASSTLVWRACGRTLFSAPLLALVLHLCVGDTWNCVTNIEQRLGVSAAGVLAVLASVYTAVAVYYKTTPLAGLLLAPSACWITIASVLTWTIWSMNEPRQPLLPREGEEERGVASAALGGAGEVEVEVRRCQSDGASGASSPSETRDI